MPTRYSMLQTLDEEFPDDGMNKVIGKSEGHLGRDQMDAGTAKDVNWNAGQISGGDTGRGETLQFCGRGARIQGLFLFLFFNRFFPSKFIYILIFFRPWRSVANVQGFRYAAQDQ